jgi:transcriptional regulator of arginine metabolism
MERSDGSSRPPDGARAGRRARLQAIREIVGENEVANQEQLAALLRDRGFEATQATVSRDIAELRLVKGMRGSRQVYAAAADLASEATPPPADDVLLERVLRDVPFQVRRSGLTLVLVGTPGTASIVAEAIDHSTLREQVGTLAGDNTVLVLFEDAPALERWQSSILELQARATSRR